MTPGRLDLPTVWRGCDYADIIMQWKDQNGIPFNLDGWVPSAFTRSGVNLNARVTDASSGFTRMSMTQEQTAAMRLGVDAWDWIWTGGGVTQPPVLAGKIEVKEPYTPTNGSA